MTEFSFVFSKTDLTSLLAKDTLTNISSYEHCVYCLLIVSESKFIFELPDYFHFAAVEEWNKFTMPSTKILCSNNPKANFHWRLGTQA